MNRCLGYNINNIKCRAKTKNNTLFCCKNHEPLNKELIEGCCFMCMEKIVKTCDIIFFPCKHAFHKQCYFEWLTFSKYEDEICMVCRNTVVITKPKKDNKKKYKKQFYTNKIFEISFILNGNVSNSSLTSPYINTSEYGGVTGPSLSNPGITGPFLSNSGITGPFLSNSGITGPSLSNPGITGPYLSNPGMTGPSLPNLGITGPSLPNLGMTGPYINSSDEELFEDDLYYNNNSINYLLYSDIIVNDYINYIYNDEV